MFNATPFFFGSEHRLFGWYHRPLGSVVRSSSVVLCPPLGKEYMDSYRVYRHLAERLAANGFPALRLEYEYTGNSAGEMDEKGMLSRWTDSVRAAIEELKARSGNSSVALLGMRMGASVAALATSGRTDIAAMVFWEPCPNGRSYIRQVQMLAMANEHVEVLPPEMGIDAAGFRFNRATISELSAVQLIKLPRLPKVPTLILSREDFPQDDLLAAHFTQLGATVDQQTFSGYATLMVATNESVLPELAVSDLVSWFDRVLPGEPSQPNKDVATPAAQEQPALVSERQLRPFRKQAPVVESLVRFGDDLFGVLTTPEVRDPAKPAVVLLNTAADHHVGPHRVYVPLARQWAAQGYAVLRWDTGGVGASPARPGEPENAAYLPRAIDDVSSAVSYMKREGYDRTVLIGLCSGAYNAVHAVHRGADVVGTVAVNLPFHFRPDPSMYDPVWNKVEMATLMRNLFSGRKWGRFFRGKIRYRYVFGLLTTRLKQWGDSSPLHVLRGSRESVVKETKSTDFAELMNPNIRTHLIFSKDDPGHRYFEHAIGNLRPILQAREGFSMEVLDDADHTFMSYRLQGVLVKALTQALRRYTELERAPTLAAFAAESSK